MKTLIKLISAKILILLGFASCSQQKEIPLMYGIPMTEFKAMGNVVNSNQEPLEGIQVIAKNDGGYIADTVYTDSQGNYHIQLNYLTGIDDLRSITFSDLDGEQNGGNYHINIIYRSSMNIEVIEEPVFMNGKYESVVNAEMSKK